MGKLAKSYKDGGRRLQANTAMKKILRIGGESIGCTSPSLFSYWVILESW